MDLFVNSQRTRYSTNSYPDKSANCCSYRTTSNNPRH